MLPFPNDHWRVPRDDGTYRLNFTIDTFPIDDNGLPIDPVAGKWNELHGFPVMPAITAYFPRLDESSIDSCAHWWNIEVSENMDSSPIILLDTVTMKQVPHWVELDHASFKEQVSEKRGLLIWPATALDFNRRYIVAIKPLRNRDGVVVSPSPLFQQLRDGVGVASRQTKHNDIFETLEKVGVNRKDLLLTWDFTTNTKTDVTGRLVSARDDARKRLGTDGPDYRIASVETEGLNELIGKQIKGQFRMPTYLNTRNPTPSSRLVLDEHSEPVFQGYDWYDFEVMVPKAFMDSPGAAGILQYGHGLFGTYKEVEYGSSDYMYEDATDYGYVICASTWIGLSSQDVPAMAEIIGRDLTDFQYIPDRTIQGVVNALGLMTMLKGKFGQDPEMLTTTDGLPIINPEKTAYFGNSEGGIFGTVYMAASQDVKRGLLGVPGGPYSLLLPRSLDFGAEFDIMKLRYNDPVDRLNLMQVMQLLWDRAEPAGFMKAVSRDPLPDTQPKEVLLHYGLGDAQVTWLGAQAIARSVDAVQYASSAKENGESFFGLELIADDVVVTGRSGIQGWDYGSAQAPLVNTPPSDEGDTHGCPRNDDRAQVQMGAFFLTGQISNVCGGTCVTDPATVNHCDAKPTE